MMHRIAGSLAGLGLAVALGGCAGGGPVAFVVTTDPVVVTSVADGEPVRASVPTSTAAPIPETTAGARAPTTTVVEPSPSAPSVSHQINGVVVAVDGDLSEIRSFSLLLLDGSAVELVPQPGLLFDGGPLSHLRDHLVSGVPVAVEYHVEAGVSIATRIGDAP